MCKKISIITLDREFRKKGADFEKEPGQMPWDMIIMASRLTKNQKYAFMKLKRFVRELGGK